MKEGKTFHTTPGYNGGEKLSITRVWFPMQILAVKFSVRLQIIVYPSHTPQSSFTLRKHFCLSVHRHDQLSSHPLGPSETWSGTGGERKRGDDTGGRGGGGGSGVGGGGEKMKREKENNQHSNEVRPKLQPPTVIIISIIIITTIFFSLLWCESSALKSLN